MILVSLVLSSCLVAQTGAQQRTTDPFSQPRLEPSRRARVPAADADDDVPLSGRGGEAAGKGATSKGAAKSKLGTPRSAAAADDGRYPARRDEDDSDADDSSQTSPRRNQGRAAADREDEAATGLVPVRRSQQKLRPPELLAEALAKPKQGAFDDDMNATMTLADAVSRVTDRQQQLKVILAYWKLSESQAYYHFALDQRDRFARLSDDLNEVQLPAVQATRAAFRGMVGDAQLAVLKSQHELAEAIKLKSGEPLPLTVDRPHVGDYNTAFDTLFAERTPPPRLRLIHRTLPIRRKGIDEHSNAIQNGLDALDAIEDEYSRKATDIDTLLAAWEHVTAQRKAFIASVRRYNQEIAEYALNTAKQGASSDALVAMLIGAKKSGKSATPRRDREANPAPEDDVPSSARPRTFGDERDAEDSRDEPQTRRSSRGAETANPESGRRRARKPEADANDGADVSLYRGLLGVSDDLRAKRLADVLYLDRSLPKDSGTPITLSESLKTNVDRRAVLLAYWKARERASRYQALVDQEEGLRALSDAAMRLRNQPAGAVAMLRLQAAKQGLKGNLLDEYVALVIAEFTLTQTLGKPLDAAWLLPSTAPHAGGYRLRLRSQPRSLVEQQQLAQFGILVPLLHGQLVHRSESIVQADVARADATAVGADGPHAFHNALKAIDREKRETFAFLRAATNYNLAIGEYVLSVFPASTSPEKLVEALIVVHDDKPNS